MFPDDIYAFDSAEFDALARDIQAAVVTLEPGVTDEVIEARLAEALLRAELLRQPDRVREDEGVGRVRAKRPQGDVSQLPGKIGGEEVGAAVDRVDGLTVGLLAGTGSGPVGEPLFQGREDGPELTRRERRPQARPPPFGQAWKRTRAIVPSR